MRQFKFRSKRRLKLFFVWLTWMTVGLSFYIVDCLVVTYSSNHDRVLDIPWFKRGIYAGGQWESC
jgi:hypothetical protein